jgi:hypothetical protein
MQTELLFLGTILRLLREQIAWLPTQQQMLQERAFHFVQEIDRFVSQPELSKQRTQLLRLAKDILGELSRSALVLHFTVHGIRASWSGPGHLRLPSRTVHAHLLDVIILPRQAC